MPHTNALIRRLQDDPLLRAICGFNGHVPHRTTFNRFIRRLAHHWILVENTLATLTNELKELLPSLGQVVAVDSTTVRTHGNPNRTVLSDPEASWTAKNSPRAKDRDGKEWHYGYKLHSVVDTEYGLPLGHLVTTAKRNDSPLLPPLIEHTQQLHPWFTPRAVAADRGYDSKANHVYLNERGVASIIHVRRNVKAVSDNTHSLDGRPFCMGQQPMEHVVTNPVRGHLYRCPPEGCHLKDSMAGGVRHCDTEFWEHPRNDIRFFSWIPRHTQTWKDLYDQRQAVERFFKSVKESRRLERHCTRGLRNIRLHALMSALGFQATALVKVREGLVEDMRWMVRRVA